MKQLPKKGDKLYIPTTIHISRGEDDIQGGLAVIENIEVRECANPINTHFVSFEGIPGVKFNLKLLLEEQEELKTQFGEQMAKPDPDVNTPWMEKKQYLSLAKLKAAYNAYKCTEWTNSIRKLLSQYCTLSDDHDIEIPQTLLDKLMKEGTDEQKKYVESLGITLKEDRNAFINKFEWNEILSISNKLFGNNLLQIAEGVADIINRTDLEGRSLLVDPSCKVNLIETEGYGTIIEILKK